MKTLRAVCAAFVAVALFAVPAFAEGRIVLDGLRMDPSDVDARRFSKPAWGGGIELVAPLPMAQQIVAGVFGVDYANLLSKTVKFQDPTTLLRVEQQTEQHYVRLYLGGQFGPHSTGFLRPYAGANLALVLYGISTDVVVPDSRDRENEIRQNLRDEEEAAFGWDVNAGLDLRITRHFSLDGGVRWLHAYGVPQQLGAGAVTIQPSYLQYKVGVAIPLRTFTH